MSRWQAIASIAAKIGGSANTLDAWVKKAEVDSGRCKVRRQLVREGIDVARCTLARLMKDTGL